jgi:hypothetical protein
MATETEICNEYEAELAVIAALDRAYYQKTTITSADRADYFKRQEGLETVRVRLYQELATVRRAQSPGHQSFRVTMNDLVSGKPVVSAPQCRLARDLANAVGVIIGRCELLQDSLPKEAGLEKHLDSIRDSARKIALRIKESACPKGDLEAAVSSRW